MGQGLVVFVGGELLGLKSILRVIIRLFILF